MSTAAIAQLIQRLDLLDGVQDAHYKGLPLHVENATGVCEARDAFKEEVQQQNMSDKVGVNAALQTPDGLVTVDCKILAERLNRLIDTAQKIPATKWMAKVRATMKPPKDSIPTREDFYAYHLVDSLIGLLLVGLIRTDESFGDFFNALPFEINSQVVQFYGILLQRPDFQEFKVDNVAAAFKLFQDVGKKYGFDTTPFQPTSAPRNLPHKEVEPTPPRNTLPTEKDI